MSDTVDFLRVKSIYKHFHENSCDIPWDSGSLNDCNFEWHKRILTPVNDNQIVIVSLYVSFADKLWSFASKVVSPTFENTDFKIRINLQFHCRYRECKKPSYGLSWTDRVSKQSLGCQSRTESCLLLLNWNHFLQHFWEFKTSYPWTKKNRMSLNELDWMKAAADCSKAWNWNEIQPPSTAICLSLHIPTRNAILLTMISGTKSEERKIRCWSSYSWARTDRFVSQLIAWDASRRWILRFLLVSYASQYILLCCGDEQHHNICYLRCSSLKLGAKCGRSAHQKNKQKSVLTWQFVRSSVFF